MRMNWNIVSVVAVAAVAFVVGRAGVPTGAGSAALAAGQPEGDVPPEVAAMMAAGMPGKSHEKLNALVGIFDVSGTAQSRSRSTGRCAGNGSWTGAIFVRA